MAAIPPPPPMPMPPPVLNPSSNKKKITSFKPDDDEGKSEIRKLCQVLINRLNLVNEESLLVHHKTCQPILQDGPMCGLVAVCMAAELMSDKKVSVDEVITIARRLGYTKQGEMFSAVQMCDLVQQVIECHAVVCSDLAQQQDLMINTVVAGNPVLVPYDADGNHEPCLKKGRKAHWAVVTGVLYLTANNETPGCHYEPDAVLPQVYHYTQKGPIAAKLTNKSTTDIYILAYQGKSRHLALWSLNSLFDSNRNLEELEPKIASNLEDYVLPPGGPAEGLKGHIICLQRELNPGSLMAQL